MKPGDSVIYVSTLNSEAEFPGKILVVHDDGRVEVEVTHKGQVYKKTCPLWKGEGPKPTAKILGQELKLSYVKVR